jgi:hypothetical protein
MSDVASRQPAAGDVWEHDGIYYEVQVATLPGDVALTGEGGLVAMSHRHSCMSCRIHNMAWLAVNGTLVRPYVAPVPVDELAELNPGLDQRGLARLQAFEQLLAEDDQACGYQDPEE